VVAIREASAVRNGKSRRPLHVLTRGAVEQSSLSPGGPALSATQTSIAVLHPAVSGSFIESAGMATREVPDG
jgi:hypothetical protein